jgi:hypothetical protein
MWLSNRSFPKKSQSCRISDSAFLISEMVAPDESVEKNFKLLSKATSKHGTANKNIKALNYFQSAEWSLDGSCILAAEPDNSLNLYHFNPKWIEPLEDYNISEDKNSMEASLVVQEPETIYDTAFYPHFTGQGSLIFCIRIILVNLTEISFKKRSDNLLLFDLSEGCTSSAKRCIDR